ncbi:MAG: ComF family protein [Defluviitaleaceae bacterium]|nr:ComF family protein [Defluviitaleaceae bacterium]
MMDYILKKSLGDKVAQRLHKSIFPNKCLFCQKALVDKADFACGECMEAYQVKELWITYIEGISQVFVPFSYVGDVRHSVFRFKYGMERSLATKMSAAAFKSFGDVVAGDCIIPVPLHHKRLKERGYNQSTLLAMELSALFGVPAVDGLERVKETEKLFGLSRDKRLETLAGAMAVRDGWDVCGKHIVLVDDILTTGSTAQQCAKVLLEAGAKQVDLLAFAGVIRQG